MRKRVISFILAALLIFPVMLGCRGCFTGRVYDNEVDPIVMSTADLDEVFNPFFATSGSDMGVIGITQMTMLSVNAAGNIVSGPQMPTVALAFSQETVGTAPIDSADRSDEYYETYYTTYRFLIKNDVLFSDGTPLTIDDVLFNFYIYLDPVYTGATTMYSTDIYGLKAYRNQDDDPNAYKDAEEGFQRDGKLRKTNLLVYAMDKSILEPSVVEAIEEEGGDLEIFKRYYKEDLYARWTMSAGSIEDTQKLFPTSVIDATWQVFLINEGLIPVLKDPVTDKEYIDSDYAGYLPHFSGLTEDAAKEKAVSMAYDYTLGDQVDPDSDEFGDNLAYLLQYRQAGEDALNYFIADEKTKYLDSKRDPITGKLPFTSIDGITVARNVTTFNGKYSNSGSEANQDIVLDEPHNVLEIRVNGEDPKAIYNFSIPIAPKSYYGGEPRSDANDYGVVSDIDFMFGTVRAQKVPIGAGPYKASNSQNQTNTSVPTGASGFFDSGVVYYIRNDYFTVPNKPKIRLLRIKVIKNSSLYDAIKEGEVHFGNPDATTDTVAKLNNDKSTLGDFQLDNLGYGYVGINAKYVKNINIRKAIMHSININLAIQYYGGTLAEPLYRSMSKVNSIYYPQGAEEMYKYDTSEQHEEIRALIDATDYERGSDGILYNPYADLSDPDRKLKLTFTIAGDDDAHPLFGAFTEAARVLKTFGFDIEVKKDPNALRKLANGTLTVWAAAWGSTIDPDLYQVYHKDSQATSILNWGYKSMLDGTNDIEKEFINELALRIEEGRQTTQEAERKRAYDRALDIIMELAIELPVYQRKNIFVFRKDIIDESSMFASPTAFKGPIDEIWNISFITA